MALIRSLPNKKYALADADPWAGKIVPIAQLDASTVAVQLPNDHGVEAVLPHLDRLALIAIEFPKHTDGRGYTLARLLRERHRFAGELRAVGNVLRDNLLFMHRCGFDAFELDPKYGPGGLDPASALSAFDDFDVFYQAAADVRLPLWKRVHRA